MVKAGVIGATGFTGEKIAEILSSHPEVELKYLSAKLEKNTVFSDIFPRFKKKIDLICKNLDVNEALGSSDVLFLALPHTVSFKIVPQLLKKEKKIIDLSADYRLKDTDTYSKFYKVNHADKANLKNAVYGLPEFYRSEIKNASLIANPGCYPTVSILSSAPLVKEGFAENFIIDAKTGITGGGRKPSLKFHFAHLSGNMMAYKLFSHQHSPEIDQILSEVSGQDTKVIFSPHIIPAERGILVTAYADLKKKINKKDILQVYKTYYGKEPFVRIYEEGLPELKNVVDTNFCDIGLEVSGDKIIIVSAIDNLMKGASGQAVQNMNMMLGFEESVGLK